MFGELSFGLMIVIQDLDNVNVSSTVTLLTNTQLCRLVLSSLTRLNVF